MKREKFDLGKAPHINVIQCGGNVVARGSIDSLVVVDGHELDIQQQENGLAIRCEGDLSLRLPEKASLSLEQVEGNLTLKGIEGDIAIGQVNGNGALKNAHTLTIQQVAGDLALKNINGDLTIKHIGHDLAVRNANNVNIGVIEGDFSARLINGSLTLAAGQGDVNLRTINGALTIQQIARDLNLRNQGGLVQVDGVAGDIRLYGGLISGDHQLTAAGDIVVIWPEDAPLNLSATAAAIRNRLDLQETKEMDGQLHGRLGDGETTMQLTAGGQIVLKPSVSLEWDFSGEETDDFSFDMDFGGLAEQISAQISSRMSALSSRLEHKFGEEWGRAVEEKASKATQKAEAALRRAEKAMQRSRSGPAGPVGPGGFVSAPPPPPAAKQNPVTEAEQLKILRMVEQGIITPDEASVLLEALE
jgi:DUF4097 and DUF4098 domain-containing protein YvlB